jgi:hypothetical protein
MQNNDKNSIWLSIVLVLVAIYFWDSWIILPIKFLTVFFHELSHGLAAILTGGSIAKIELNFQQGGVCYTRGGISWIVASAGYLGSLLWGCAILISNIRFKMEKELMRFLSFIFGLSALLWVRNMDGLIICVMLAVLFYLFPKYLSRFACDVLLNFVALTSCFYVIYDIKDDLIDRSVQGSDAMVLGEMFHLPGALIGGVWMVIAIVVTYKTLMYSLSDKAK